MTIRVGTTQEATVETLFRLQVSFQLNNEIYACVSFIGTRSVFQNFENQYDAKKTVKTFVCLNATLKYKNGQKTKQAKL